MGTRAREVEDEREGMIEDKSPLRDSIRSNMFTFLLKESAPVGDL